MRFRPSDDDQYELMSRLSLIPFHVPTFLDELRWPVERFEEAVQATRKLGVKIDRLPGFEIAVSTVASGRLAAELATAHLKELELRKRRSASTPSGSAPPVVATAPLGVPPRQ